MRINRGPIQVFSISFLDVLTCALAAMIILFIVVPKFPPTPEAQANIIQRLQSVVKSLTNQNETLIKEVQSKTTPQSTTPTTNPTLFGLSMKAGHAVFVIDVSGSMDWQIDNLYQTLESLVMNCQMDKFRFVYFDEYIYSSGNYWKHGWMTGVDRNKRKALQEANKYLPELILSKPAATNSGDALYAAIKTKETDTVFFITDGHPTAGDTNVYSILSRIRSMNRQNAIINTIMVGLPGASTNQYGNVVFDERARPKELYDFLHTLAEENGGVYMGR